MTEPKDRPDAELVESWERGEPIELKRDRPPTSVLSVRVPSEVLRTLTERARLRGTTTSQVARELIERGIESEEPTTPADLAKRFGRWVDEVFGCPEDS